MKKLLLLSCLFFGYAKAQDLIYKKDKSVLLAILIDIGAEEIKYKDYNKKDSPVLSIKKSDLIKIVTQRGKEILFEQNSSSSFDKKNAIKVGLLSLVAYHINLTYERSLTQSRSIELQLGIIGFGTKPDYISEASGVFTRIGYKFMHSPNHFEKKNKEFHLLKGAYFKPELVLGHFKETEFKSKYVLRNGNYYLTKNIETQVTFYALMLNVGQQWIIADDFLIDVFFGAGYGGNNVERREDNYAVSGPSPVFLNAGLKFGILIR
jgi:hypothetical protein